MVEFDHFAYGDVYKLVQKPDFSLFHQTQSLSLSFKIFHASK